MGKLMVLSLLIAALAALLGERIVNLRKRTLASREPNNKHLPNCVTLKNLDNGSEDITIMGNGLAFISTGLRPREIPVSGATGKIFTLDLQDSRMKPVELRMPQNFDLESFNPHGISVYINPTDDTIYLFVVNHPHGASQVEIFQYVEDNNSLVHVKTVKHELLHSVNDIVAVGVDSFYATNDNYFTNSLMQGLMTLLPGLPWTNLVFYSPTDVKVVSEGYYLANGVNISPDKTHIYLADWLDGKIHVFQQKDDNTLVPVKSVALDTLCDNIEVDPETGDLWLGCHPNGWKFFIYDPNDPPGSEVVRIQDIHSKQPVVTQVFEDDGHLLVGSSVAATYGGKLLIGTVLHKTLVCDLE